MKWGNVLLGDCIDITKGKKHIGVFDTNAFPYLQIEDINGPCNSKFTLERGIDVKPDDLIIAWDGANAGKVGVGLSGMIGSTLARLRISDKNIFPKFLFWFLNSKFEIIKSSRTGATIPHVSGSVLKTLEIPYPSFEVQRHIAAILDKADNLRRLNKQLIAKYDELVQAVFYEMFGDPVRNEKGWEVCNVVDVCDCIVPGRDKPKSFSGDIPWITTDDLIFLGVTRKSKKSLALNKDEISEVNAKVIPKNSVLMTCVGDLGIISIAGNKMVINQQLHAFQCKEKINNIFLMYSLSYQKNYMLKMASSTTVPYMNKTICNSIPIILPQIKLQNQFASFVQNIEAQKSLAQEALAQSEDLFQGLLQGRFKGEGL